MLVSMRELEELRWRCKGMAGRKVGVLADDLVSMIDEIQRYRRPLDAVGVCPEPRPRLTPGKATVVLRSTSLGVCPEPRPRLTPGKATVVLRSTSLTE
jgi:hypothetical protein